MGKLKIIILIFVVMASSACIDDALFNGGIKETKIIALPEFSVIEAESSFEIELVPDSINKVLISCGENLQKNVSVEVVDNVLFLRHDIKNSWSRNYERVKLKLHSKPFSRINVRKPVKIFNTILYKGPTFSIVDYGKYTELDVNVAVNDCLVAMSSDNFGSFKIRGTTHNAQIWGWGSCNVRADSLISENCYVLHRGFGNVFVHAKNQLDVSIEFTGNVYYSGNPINVNIQQRLNTGNLFRY